MTFNFERSHYFYSSRKVQQNLANNLILFPRTSLTKTLPVHLSLTIPVITWRRHHSQTFLIQFTCLWLWLILFPFNFALGLRMQRLYRGRPALCDTPCVCNSWHFVNSCCPLFQKQSGDQCHAGLWHQASRPPDILILISNKPRLPFFTSVKVCFWWLKKNGWQIVFDGLLTSWHSKPSSNRLVQTAKPYFLLVNRLKVRWQSVTIFYGTHNISQNATTALFLGTPRFIEFIKTHSG